MGSASIMTEGEVMCSAIKEGGRHYLSGMHTNANNLQNKINELRGRIDRFKPDIVGITEVWMKEVLVVQGYHPAFPHDKEESKKGGRVLPLVKNC